MTNNIMSADRRQTIPHAHTSPRIDFGAINRAALRNAETVCRWLLPGGRRAGREYLALNPRRADRTIGSLKVNLATGRWADFATDDRGGDLIALTAWVLTFARAKPHGASLGFLGISAEVRS